MKRIRTYLDVKYTVACLLVGKVMIRAFLLVMGLVVLGAVVGTLDSHGSAPVQAPPASTPTTDSTGMAPHERPTEDAPVGDGFADGHLFNPDAVLDTSHIDDLRDDPAGACIAQHKVYTQGGSCLPGVLVYPSDVPAPVFDRLTEQGYAQVVDINLSGDVDAYGSLFVPERAMVTTDDGRWIFTEEGAILQPLAGH